MPTEARAARTLWLLRHAKTVADPPPGGADFDRVLAPRGRRDAAALGRLFAGAGEGLGPGLQGVPRPQLALVSPAARTVRRPSSSWPTSCPSPAPLRRGPLRGRPRRGARRPPHPVRRHRGRHGRRPQPDGPVLSQGLLSTRDKKGLVQRGAARLPHLRARRVLIRRRPVGRGRGRDRRAGRPDAPSLLSRGRGWADPARRRRASARASVPCRRGGRCGGRCGRTGCR